MGAVSSVLFALLASHAVAALPCELQVDVRGPGVPDEVVEEFRERVVERADHVASRLGASACAPVAITLVPAMEQAGTLDPPWHLPSWAAGAAQPAARRIVIGVTANRQIQDRDQTLDHELAHVFLHEAVAGAPMPRWFNEGVARVMASEHGVADLTLLARASLVDGLLPLGALREGFPAEPTRAALAYAQAGRAVSLVEGAGHLPAVIAGLRAGASFEESLTSATGRATWQLDLDVQRSIPRWRALAIVGLETDFAMAACAAVVIVAGTRARRRLRERMAAMEDPTDGAFTSLIPVTRWTVPKRA